MARPRKEQVMPMTFWNAPYIPIVKVSDFSKARFSEDELKSMWEIVGPSVHRNLSQNLELWKVITMAYFEGLMHGSGIMKNMIEEGRWEENPVPADDGLTDYIHGSLSG